MNPADEFQHRTKEELIKELKDISKEFNSLKSSFHFLDKEKIKIQKDLNERKKELRTVYKLGSLREQKDLSLSEILRKTVELIPSGWQYPEITCARIVLGEDEYKTANFKISEWKQSENILIDNQPAGRIEVFYLEDKPDEYNGPFLKEQQNLLKSFAESLTKIIERKQLEEDLLLSEEIFSMSFKKSPVAKSIIDISDNSRFLHVNNAFLEISGYTKKEVLGRTAKDLHFYANPKIYREIISLLKSNGIVRNLEYVFIKKNREARVGLINIEAIHQNGKKLALVAITDITEINKTQIELVEAEARYRSLVQSQSDVISRSDFEGNLTFANDSYCQTFGIKQEDISEVNYRSTIIPEDLPKLLEVIDFIQKPPYKKYIEIRNITTSGIRWFGWDNMAVVDENGEITEYQGVGRDITERKLAEKRLKERDTLNSTLINTIPYGMDIIDESGTILFASENMKKRFGSDIVGKNCWETYRTDKKQCTYCPLKKGISTGVTKVFESTGIIDDRIFEISHTGLIYEGKEAVLEIFHDITSQKKAEKELRDSEEKFRSLFENMNEGFALHQLVKNEKGEIIDYRVMDVNSSYERIIGISAEEARGALSSNLYGTGVAPYLKEYAEVVKNNKPITFETFFPELDKYFNISVTSPIPGFFATIFSDVTDRIKNEEKIRESENRFQLIAKNVSDVIWMYNLTQDKFTYVSPSVERLRGFTAEEATKLSLDEMLYPNDYESIVQIIAGNDSRFKKGKKSRILNNEVPLKCKDGGLVWAEISTYFQKNNKGEIEIFGVSRNIEERKSAEKELKGKEERLQSILDNMQDAYVQADLSGNFTFVNPAAVQLYGYNSFEEMIGMPASSLYANAKDREELLNMLHISGKITDWICRGIRKDKTVLWVSMNVQFLKDNLGKVVGTEEVVRDITERIEKEKELKIAKERAEESEIRFKAISENALEGITLADLNGNYVFVNEAFAKIVGYSKQELLKMNITDLKLPEDKDSTLFHILKQNKIQKVGKSSRTRLLCKDNSTIHVDINATLLDIGIEKFALGIIRDVSEIVQWENELIKAKEKAEESENRFRTIAEQITEGITVADLEGNYVYVNNAFCEMSGYSRDELLQMTVFNMAEPELVQKAKSAYGKENVTGQKRHVVLRKKDGSAYNTEIAGTFIEINKQKLILGSIRDISEIVKYQNDLIAAKEKAEESNRLKSSFLMNMSHEIRSPMNGILGFLNLLDQPDLSDADRSNFINIVNKSGERLMNTINDIVEISKIEVGDINLVNQDFDVSELMQFHFDFFKIQTDEKGIDFRITEQLVDNPAVIKTDMHKLDGILMNLIRNAIKFTTKGTIKIGNYIENDNLYFYVTDSGRGIRQDKLEVIFDRFVQAELGNTRGYEGSGLGLSIVKAYIEALNGTIEVKSEVGKGSTFLFSIPYHPAIHTFDQIETTQSDKIISSKCTILVAEDDEINFYYLENILSKEYSVLHAVSGEETVKLFMDNPGISLILMDIRMPGDYDGLEATRRIRQLNQEVPIIAQTAYAMEFDKTRVFEAGCNNYISKPFTTTDLKILVKQYCNKKDNSD